MTNDKLFIPRGQGPLPSATQHNNLADLLLRGRLCGGFVRTKPGPPFASPWSVTTQRFAAPSPPATTPFNPAATWRVDVAAGTVNDDLATISYLRTGDPRGWTPPASYIETSPLPARSPYWIDRPALDDPDDPPFLTLQDPAPSATSSPYFSYIPDGERPYVEAGAFCGTDDWQMELWRSFVVLSASVLNVNLSTNIIAPPPLARYRLYTAAVKPDLGWAAQVGGWIILATLYLLRDPKNPLTNASLLVRQNVWWNLCSVIIQPGQGLLTNAPSLIGIAGFGTQLAILLESAAYVDFWTV